MSVGKWEINVTDKYPQKVATAISKLGDVLVGAEYEPIAYLGSQLVNGTNHAVLAKQTVLTGRDVSNVVVLVFNEKPGEGEATLVGIERVLESGGELGGAVVDVWKDIPAGAMNAWNEAFSNGFVGARVTPFALLGTQVAKGVNHIFAAEYDPAVMEPEKKVVLATVNDMTKSVFITDLLENKYAGSLNYAFNW